MSIPDMREERLDETHRALLDMLQEGRITPSYAAAELDESRQFINSRLNDLLHGEHIQKLHRGLYELRDDPREATDE